MDTTLTRRGWIVAGLAVVSVALGTVFGARSLDAIVAPAIVVLGAGLFVVQRAEAPTTERTVPPDGHPGETHSVKLRASAGGIAVYSLRDQVSQWLEAPDADHDLTDADDTFEYEVRYVRRGVHELGPVSVAATDVLGLAERSLPPVGETDRVLVHPTLVEPPEAVRSALTTVVDLERRPGRDEFDRLREYVRGDSLRDVHWKSSAKRPDEDLVVKEFLGRTPTDAVRIGVSATGDRDTVDAAARAAASVAVTLLDEGVDVGLETPTESIEPSVGTPQRTAILASLARLEAGRSDAPATIEIVAREGLAHVQVGGRSVAFDSSAATSAGPAASGIDSEDAESEEVVG